MILNPDIGIIILAAGASTRMGRPKQLLTWQGETLIRRAVQTALVSNCHSTVVVLGAYANEIRKEIEQLDVLIIENHNWQQGMSTSIRIGLKALLATNPNIQAALFMLVDQPLLTSAHLERLIDTRYQMPDASIFASFYNEKASVPALFHRKWFEQLLHLKGDQGARALFQAYPNEVLTIPFPDGAFDLDTPENYEQLTKNKNPPI